MENKIDLNEIIATTLEKTIKTDLPNLVEKEVKKCLENVINDIFGYNSKVRDNLKDKFQSLVGVCLDNLKIENYNTMVLNAIQNSINNVLVERVEKQIQEQILSKISILEKTEYKLSEIVEEFKKEIFGDLDDYDECNFTVEIERSSSDFVYIYLDEEESQSKYRCKYRICLYKGKVTNCHPIKAPENKAYGFENFLFGLYANKVKIEIDTDYDTYISKY